MYQCISSTFLNNKLSQWNMCKSSRPEWSTSWLSVDESMARCYGWHGCEEFIRGKQIHFGYKLWSLAPSSNLMYHMEPHGGSHILHAETGLSEGSGVVLSLPKSSFWCQYTEGLPEVTPGMFWPKETIFWLVGKTITLSQWQQTWRRNTVRPLSRDGTRGDVPLTKSHNQNASTNTMSTWGVLTFTTYRFQDTICRSGLRSGGDPSLHGH